MTTSSLHRARRRLLVAAVTCSLAGAAAAVTPAAATAPVDADTGTGAFVAPGLLADLARGPAPAILSWDDARTTRDEVESYLDRHGLAHSTFSRLDMAVVCTVQPGQVGVLAGAPGALSVWGDEQLAPVLEQPTVAAPSTAGPAVRSAAADTLGFTGKGVGIAVIDTGIDGTHRDVTYPGKTVLNARMVLSHLEFMGPGNDSCIPDRSDETLPDSESVSGHGTYLAGVAAGTGAASGGTTHGVASGASLVGISVLEQATPEYTGDVSFSLIRFISAVNFLLVRTLEGGPTVSKVALIGWTSKGLYDPWHPHSLAIRDLDDFGVSVVVPVGNGGPQASRCDQAETCSFNKLAVGYYVTGVAASPPGNATALADYSSRGDEQARQVRDESVVYEPYLVAPGTARGPRRAGLAPVATATPTQYGPASSGTAPTTDPGDAFYVSMTGTAVAAAHVAGAIAVMQEAARSATGCFLPTHVIRALLGRTATPMSRPRWEVGAGALDISSAVAAARAERRYFNVDPWMCPPS